MDDTDHQLLALLRENARAPVARLATQLGVSRATVQNRIDRMLRDRVLLGFTVRVTTEAARRRVRATMLVGVEGDHAESVLMTLRGYPEVRALHTTNGRWDLVVELETETLEDFDRVLQRIRNVKGIVNSETNLLLSTHKL
jgi:DNA-binding Lrp family transcriptional regulator